MTLSVTTLVIVNTQNVKYPTSHELKTYIGDSHNAIISASSGSISAFKYSAFCPPIRRKSLENSYFQTDGSFNFF